VIMRLVPITSVPGEGGPGLSPSRCKLGRANLACQKMPPHRLTPLAAKTGCRFNEHHLMWLSAENFDEGQSYFELRLSEA